MQLIWANHPQTVAVKNGSGLIQLPLQCYRQPYQGEAKVFELDNTNRFLRDLNNDYCGKCVQCFEVNGAGAIEFMYRVASTPR